MTSNSRPIVDFILAAMVVSAAGLYRRVDMVDRWLDLYNEEMRVYEREAGLAEYNFLTNITKENKMKVMAADKSKSMWMKEMLQQARQLDPTGLSEDSRRQLGIILLDAKPTEERVLNAMGNIQREMQTIYGSAKVCDESGKCMDEGDLKGIMAQSRDYDTLIKAWKGFRDATGPKIRAKYPEFVKLLNVGARENGFRDMGYFWRLNEMDSADFDKTAMQLYEQLKPMYLRLHAYVRHKLKSFYPNHVTSDGPIPAHLLGNLWAQNWNNLIDITAPYPEVEIPSITDALERQNYTALSIFRTAERFYRSIGLLPMTDKFWRYSMLEQPKDGRKVMCHGTAFDFFTQDDFRIKKCTRPTTDDFVSVHHEMGHVEYFMHYRHQPSLYKSSPNTGFHEGLADISSLSVLTPSYLSSLNLASRQADQRSYMNSLMEMALRKVAFLPFGLMIDLWRWKVFNGSIAENEYNHQWWKLRLELQGIVPPVDRDETDFDPGAKAHIPHNVPYIRYFVSFISQFQFHRSLCAAAGHQGPLYLCNIAGSREAGALLRRFMALGRSRPWPQALEVMTGSTNLDATAILDYFQPLMNWFDDYIERNRVTVGWKTRNLGVSF